MKIKGNGSIRPVKNKKGEIVKNSWQLILSLGIDPITGKRIQKTRHFRGTKTQARRALEEFRREVELGIKIDADRMTFKDYAASWLAEREESGRLAPTTLSRDRRVIEQLNEQLSDITLRDIDPQTVRYVYSKINQSGLSQATVAKIAGTLKQILKQAVIDEVLIRNPCDAVPTPRQPKSKVSRALDREGVAMLLAKLNELEQTVYPLAKEPQQKATVNAAFVISIKLILATGVRHGEILALTWHNVDFEHSLLHVTHTMDRITNKRKKTKTESGVRDIALDSAILNDLAVWKNRQKKYLNYLGIEQGASTPLITGEAGTLIGNTNLARMWRLFREKNGFQGLRLHDLRHTHASLLVQSGQTSLKAISMRLGHSKVGTTMDLYTHRYLEDDVKAASIIGEIMAASPSSGEYDR